MMFSSIYEIELEGDNINLCFVGFRIKLLVEFQRNDIVVFSYVHWNTDHYLQLNEIRIFDSLFLVASTVFVWFVWENKFSVEVLGEWWAVAGEDIDGNEMSSVDWLFWWKFWSWDLILFLFLEHLERTTEIEMFHSESILGTCVSKFETIWSKAWFGPKLEC